LLLWSPSAAFGADEEVSPVLSTGPIRAGPVLTLEEAIARASGDQPALLAYEREAQASEQAAIAARSLPDLQLMAGIQNFPITGENAVSPTDDFMTMYMIGIMREQVRRSKREAEARRIRAEALVSRRQAGAQERRIRLDVMLAWIDAVEARAKQDLLARLIADLRTGRKVMEAGIPTGGSTPALAFEAEAEVGLAGARLADAMRAEDRARAELARWIGQQAASRPLPASLPTIEPPPGLQPNPGSAHPELLVAQAEQEAALSRIDVAREERKRDFSWQVSLGLRPNYGQMLSAQVSIPLKLSRRNREDRLVAEARARADAAALRLEDMRRDLKRRHAVAEADYQGAEAELERIERDAIPSLESAFKAAEARYSGGVGTLEQPFQIVRRYLEVTLQSIETRAKRARAAAEMVYVIGEDGR
jgi:cobalt-zinc-cadmium efflux system outer membrane protein